MTTLISERVMNMQVRMGFAGAHHHHVTRHADTYLFFPSSLSPIAELMPSMLLARLPARGREVEAEARTEAGEVGVDMIL